MAAQDFQVTFDGPAVQGGRMAVRDLAPSLIALGDLFGVARERAEPDLPELTLEVRAFQPGSFANLLGLAFDAAVALLVADPTAAVTNLLTLVTHGKTGLLAVARALQGKQVVDLQPVEDKRDYSIGKNNDGKFINAPNSVFNMYMDPRVFEMVSTFFDPLRKPGYESVRVTNPVEPFVATKPEVQDMPVQPEATEQAEGKEIGRSERETVLSIVSAPLQHPIEHKWKFNEGGGTTDIWARVTHMSWLADLQARREHLDVGDRIKARLLQIQKEHPEKGLQVDYEVVEVLDHLGPPPRSEQPGLFNGPE